MINKDVIWLDSVDSTNTEAFRLIEKGIIKEGAIVAARDQKAGRGQGDTSWESKPRMNLTFSVVLMPKFIPPAQQFILNQSIAIGLLEGLENVASKEGFKIKWPNDLYFDRFKVAGILIENRIVGPLFDLSVVGIGVNLNQEKFSSAAPNPLSLKNISGKDFELEKSLKVILDSIFGWYNKLEAGDIDLINSAYLNHLLGLNEYRRYLAGGQEFTAMIIGLDEYGRLKIKKQSGAIEVFDSKEIQFLR